MQQPIGFIVLGQDTKVCKLQHSIYVLKQSCRQQNSSFHKTVISYGFTMIMEDHFVCIKNSEKFFVILSLYVDVILLANNDQEYLLFIKGWLSSNFEMKYMGEAEFI